MPVVAVVGPSGAGKDTLLAEAALRRPDLHIVRRVVTRPESAGGEPYEGVTPEEFQRRLAAGAFALHWGAHGLRYGIPVVARTEAEAGKTVLFNGSRSVLREAAEVFPGLVVLHVTARPETLARRLAGRGRESEAAIADRLRRAGNGLPDGLPVREVCNDACLDTAVEAFLRALPA